MRYILDNDGYVELCSETHIECNGRGCTEYTGEVPAGYESVEDWAINANIRAYRIVDGNLVYDANRDSMLEVQFEKEAEDNRYVCHKEISNITNLVKTDSVDAYKRSTTGLSNILEVTDSNKYASDFIKLVANENLTGSITLKFNNGNLLTNDATSKRESGIYFVVNADRSISINGTATEDIEFNIGGTNTSTKPILALKKNANYYLSSNGLQIKMYNYDGTDRTEVYNGTGGTINLSSNSKVTNIVLAIANGTSVNTTIYPMLNLGTEANEYVTYEGNESTIYLDSYVFDKYSGIEISENEVLFKTVLFPKSEKVIKGLTPNGTLTPSENLTPNKYEKLEDAIFPSDTLYPYYTKINELEECIRPYTYLDKTYMYAYEDVNLMVTYPNIEKNLDLCGYETPNNGFGVDDEGNMYCNNATIRGSAIINGSNFSVDKEGNMYANNGTFKGHVEAESGTFKGSIISSNANITGGNIVVTGGNDVNKIKVETTGDSGTYMAIANRILTGYIDGLERVRLTPQSGSLTFNNYDEMGASYTHNGMFADYNGKRRINIWSDGHIIIKNNNDSETFRVNSDTGNVKCVSLTQTSLEESKKNFEKYNSALEEIEKIDIYKYHLKNEEESHKKHLGFIIGDNYNYSSEITAVDEEGKEIGVDLYSMTSLCLQAIKEQQEIIEQLKEEIKLLKESE